MTSWTFPNKIFVDLNFSIKPTFLTIVRFGVEFTILNCIINVRNKCFKCFHIIIHIRNFNIRDTSTRRNLLELRFKFNFTESINRLSNVYMIRISIITLISNIFNFTKLLFINLCKSIAKTFSCLYSSRVVTSRSFIFQNCSYFHKRLDYITIFN